MRTYSVIINTLDRADSLRLTLQSLRLLDDANLEVVVVAGPVSDHTHEVLASFDGAIKVGHCPEPNLSMSRNIGVSMAAGEIVAFIDDDAYPDPAWLQCLDRAFDDPEVVAAGGPVHDYTGVTYQAQYVLADRFGNSWSLKRNPSFTSCSPIGRRYVAPMGTNVAFRREVLEAVGGFDEEYEYYLEETDIICRLVELGHAVRAVDDGVVFHKFLPSHIRNADRVPRNQYSIIKNHAYFAFKHGLEYSSFAEVTKDIAAFIEKQTDEYRLNMSLGRLTEADFEAFKLDVDRACDDALARFRSGQDRRRARSWFAQRREPFLPYPLTRPAGRRLHLCLLSQDYPPRPMGGVGRWVHSLATGLAGAGHVVRVLTRGEDHDTVDLEDGVWVHRMVVRHHDLPDVHPGVPQELWNYSSTLRAELHRIHERRPVDLVQFPNWDAEGIAVVIEGKMPTVVGLVTPLRSVLAHDPRLQESDPKIAGLMRAEEYCYAHADAFMASGPGILEEIDRRYGVTFPPERTGVVALGLPDHSADAAPSTAPGDAVEILFVGRLEPRKGIDTLLECAPGLLAAHPNVRLSIVGDDSPTSPGGPTYAEWFRSACTDPAIRDRVVFTGRLSDDELVKRYASCDVFVAPSRFESFGLILLEAMMMSKPVVGCDVGGMRMIVAHGENGFLVPPGDHRALGDALWQLVVSSELRERFGRRGREIYDERFSRERMVSGAEAFYASLISLGAPVPTA